MYIICFKGGQKIKVSELAVKDITKMETVAGFTAFKDMEGKFIVTINLNEIAYIQPEENELKNGLWTTIPVSKGNSTATNL